MLSELPDRRRRLSASLTIHVRRAPVDHTPRTSHCHRSECRSPCIVNDCLQQTLNNFSLLDVSSFSLCVHSVCFIEDISGEAKGRNWGSNSCLSPRAPLYVE